MSLLAVKMHEEKVLQKGISHNTRPSSQGLTFLHLILVRLLASLFWPPTDEMSDAPDKIAHAFLWRPLAVRTHSLQFMFPDVVLSPAPPQRAPLPALDPLLAASTSSEVSCPAFQHIVWLHQTHVGETYWACEPERVFPYLKGTKTVWTHKCLGLN